MLREGAPILDAAHLPAVAAGSPMVVEECRNLPRLHDCESLSREFEARPDFLVCVEGDSLAGSKRIVISTAQRLGPCGIAPLIPRLKGDKL